MTDKAIENSIFKYFDKNGIPFEILSQVSVQWTRNIYNEDYLSNEVEHNLNRPNCRIKNIAPFKLSENELGKIVLKYISETTGVHLDDIGQIVTNPTYNGVPFLLQLNEHGGTKKVTLAKKNIPGSLILRADYNNCGLKSLGKIERINGFFGISDSPIQDLGSLKKVKGDFWITRYNDYLRLFSLNPLIEVGGNLTINDRNIVSLGTVEKVKGNLNLRKSVITDLGALKFVGG